MKEDIKSIREIILAELEAHLGTDVAILTHSHGGLPGLAAIENLDKKSRIAAGFQNRVSALLPMASLLVPAGVSGFDWGGGNIPPSIVVKNVPSPVDGKLEVEMSTPNPNPVPIELFYHDVPQKEAEHYSSLLIPQVISVFRTPVPFAGWKIVPIYYLIAEEDKAFSPEVQRMIIDQANEARLQVNPDGGKLVVVESVQASHSPFLSKLDETAAWIRRSLGETV
ncbi:uncharacterized protein A1O9_01596 [Exophiala aquamarina CBS 119918]|uniref:AB hydrolase-1 domain-containing protein n=1 Tax=Exophiala aquamarina CBS 119918 TaxID=1182545 RepID=A0A072PW67_9EURO|nr:uncharacterized protein A1O9_01596 [Exophiala aquamarina CBS 119918]KEF63618.1 hypothetical protein A1O9_01596 [Exophiala aquamarina CBS 119918]